MPQIVSAACMNNVIHYLIHNRYMGYVIGRILCAEYDQIHSPDTDTIVFLQHITIKILLETIVVEGGIR